MKQIIIYKFLTLSFCISICMSICSFCYAHEFLYPIATIKYNNKMKIYVLYQKSVTHIELWLWDPETKEASKGLLSSYIPAGLKVLPSDNGFSFIDDGRIRIKKFDRRSPKAIDLYEPIYNINEINWIDEESFYMSAKKNGRLSIFHIHINGLIKTLLQDINYDYMYPQKIDDHLFYIERKIEKGEYKTEHISYRVAITDYPQLELENNLNSLMDLNQEEDFCQKAKKIEEYTQKVMNLDSEYIVDFKSRPIAFLHMISKNEGFFLEHPEDIDRHDKVITFNCYYIKKQEDSSWACNDIFSFSIPSYLILDILDFCLYESILPLLPKYHNGKIYYVDCSPVKAQNLNVFSYNLSNGIIEQKSFARAHQLMFSPVFTQNTLFYGGKIEKLEEKSGISPKMWINDQGSVCIDLPAVPLP